MAAIIRTESEKFSPRRKKAIDELLKTNFKNVSNSEQIKLQDKVTSKYFKDVSSFTHEVVRSRIGDIMYHIFSENLIEAKIVDGYESPEPGDLPEKGADMLADIYASRRKAGDDKETASKIA